MSFRKTAALASLTATYSDSESEEDEEAEDNDNDNENSLSTRLSENLENKTLLSTDKYLDTPANSPGSALSVESLARKNQTRDQTRDQQEIGSYVLSRPLSPISFHKSLRDLNPQDIYIPPESVEECSSSLQDKITRLYDKMRQGYDMNAMIEKRKDYRNPSIYEKLIAYCGIDEMATNYPPQIYDPHRLSDEAYYEDLARRQKDEMEKRERERKNKTKVEFMVGTAKKNNLLTSDNSNGSKKKSKWDIPVGLQSTSLQKK